jgi:hypothetical protein
LNPVRYCGVHFINKGEGYILSDKAFDDPEDDPNSRCIWGFVVRIFNFLDDSFEFSLDFLFK